MRPWVENLYQCALEHPEIALITEETSATALDFSVGEVILWFGEPPKGIPAFAASLGLINTIGITRIERLILSNTTLLHELLDKSHNLEAIYTDPASKIAGIVTFCHHRMPPTLLYRALRERGVMCAERGGGVRFSPHVYNTPDELEFAIGRADEI